MRQSSFKTTLENVTLAPPLDETEMSHLGRNWGDVINRLTGAKPLALAPSMPSGLENWIDRRSYPELLEEAFGTPEITPVRIAMAIATYERTLFSDHTPFDRVNHGIENYMPLEQEGSIIFSSGAARCNACHGGSFLTNKSFKNTGVRPPSFVCAGLRRPAGRRRGRRLRFGQSGDSE